MRDYLLKIAKTIEKAEADKSASFEIRKDASPVEAKILDDPEMANLLEDYAASLEAANLETFSWGESERKQLESPYRLDPDGKPEMEGGEFVTTGPGTSADFLNKFFDACKAQKEKLDKMLEKLKKIDVKSAT